MGRERRHALQQVPGHFLPDVANQGLEPRLHLLWAVLASWLGCSGDLDTELS